MITVALSPAQREVVAWAQDAMIQFWTDPSECELAEHEVVPDAILMTRDGVAIAEHREVLSDLKYRLLEMLPGVAEDESWAIRMASEKSATYAWEKIADAAAVVGISDIEAR